MANLQANLRSQSALALSNAELFLGSVNRLFYENTAESAYASLFFAEYNDETCRLRYANCGHLSGLILSSDGSYHRLNSTGTPVGLFRDWQCKLNDVTLLPGELFALYTDGITEAVNEQGEEFGEEKLLQRLREHRDKPCEDILEAVTNEVCAFNVGNQYDDVTLIVAKCHA
jgi:serine phosphatase RsbU (regulator of sigma subunit)